MKTKLLTSLSILVAQASAAGRFHHQRRDPDIQRSHLQGAAAGAFQVAADACPAVSAMPDCGAQCITQVSPANGCADPSDIACNCKNAAAIQSAAEGCVLTACGPVTAISVQSAASYICDQCAAPSAVTMDIVDAKPTDHRVAAAQPTNHRAADAQPTDHRHRVQIAATMPANLQDGQHGVPTAEMQQEVPTAEMAESRHGDPIAEMQQGVPTAEMEAPKQTRAPDRQEVGNPSQCIAPDCFA
ncbi:hypothetical protein QBC43DRAFT_335791 [Cladorrhinum sp. PSN259]|nr:hypothetical protein QBC43DRAFT_335791 [Cladorrhinum sp. PSN259]